MKRLLLAPLLLGLIPSANAGIYIYPNFKKGIEVRCLDQEAFREPNNIESSCFSESLITASLYRRAHFCQ